MSTLRGAKARRYARREVLRGGLLGSVGLAAITLVGCGSDDEAGDSGTSGSPTTDSTSALGTPQAAEGEPVRGGTLRVTGTADPTTLDPYATASSPAHTFQSYFYSRLFRFETKPGVSRHDQAIVGELAESYESPDGQTYVVHLRKGVKFHNLPPVDGREFTSADVMFSWSRLTAPETIARSNVQNVVSAEAVDDYTVKFVLDAPSPVFLDALADFLNLNIMPVESDGGFDPLVTPIGTGPFILEKYDVSSQATFKRHPEFYEEGVPYVDGIDWVIIPEYGNALAQLESGNIHLLSIQPDDILDKRAAHADWQWRGRGGTVGYLYWSSEEQSPGAPWLDERYRQAVSMSLDRAGQRELAYNVGALADAGLEVMTQENNIVPASYGSWWLDPTNPPSGDSARFFEYNMDEAKKLLDAVGAAGTSVKLQYPGTQYGAIYQLVVENIGNSMSELGLQVEMEAQDYAAVYFPQTRAGIFHGVSVGSAASYAEAGGYLHRYFSEEDSNASRIRDPQISELRLKQLVEFDPEVRRGMFHEVQRINAEHMYYCPTTYGAGMSYTAYLPQVRNLLDSKGPDAQEAYPYVWLAT